jgi:hypothetical protein
VSEGANGSSLTPVGSVEEEATSWEAHVQNRATDAAGTVQFYNRLEPSMRTGKEKSVMRVWSSGSGASVEEDFFFFFEIVNGAGGTPTPPDLLCARAFNRAALIV